LTSFSFPYYTARVHCRLTLENGMEYNEVLQLWQQKDGQTDLSTQEIERKTQALFSFAYGSSQGA